MLDSKARALAIMNVLALGFLLLRIYMAFVEPSYSFIDDLIYVGAAIHLVFGEVCLPVAGNACNYEHPPLAKLLMALGFEIFGRTQVVGANVGLGINQLGGRFFQIVMGALSAPVIYLITVKLSGNLKMAFIAGIFVLVDPLLFTLSLTAGLDVDMMFLSFVALLPYVYRVQVWKANAYLLTGAVFGLALLSKETAVFVLLALLSYNVALGEGTFGARLLSSVQILFGAAVVFAVGLQLFDSLFTSFPTFLSQLEQMISFQSDVASQQLTFLMGNANCSTYAGLCPTDKSLIPHFLYSGLPWSIIQASSCATCWSSTNPLDWLTYFPPVGFPTALVLAPNYPLVWMTFAWLPLVVSRSFKPNLTGELRAALLAAFVFLWNLASNVWVFSDLGRPVFEWYFLAAVPGLAIGGAYLVTRPSVPKVFSYLLIGLVVVVGLLLSPVAYHMFFPQPQYCAEC